MPEAVERLAAGRSLRVVWVNELRGVTWQVGDDAFVKWAPSGSGLSLGAEIERLAWAGQFIAVPRVVATGQDAAGEWVVTTALPGVNAVEADWRLRPAEAARAIGRGLRQMHEALPVARCPFSWSPQLRVARAVRRRELGELGDEFRSSVAPELTVDGVVAALADPPPIEWVVCHGDACAPNTLLAESGEVVGHVDLGALGVGDLWADLAVAAWSTIWNYGPGYEELVYDGYGVAPDPEKIRYYRLLWEVG